MKEMKKRSDIKKQEGEDKKDVDKETKRSDEVVNDAGKVDSADKKIELKGTEEGAKDVGKSVSKAMEETKKTHEKLDKNLEKKFGVIKETEKNLSDRSNTMNKDAQEAGKEKSAMSSGDTKAAQKEMAEAEKNAAEDANFLKEHGEKEKEHRETGEKEMKQQKSKLGKMKVRKR